ncbi:hypothetical protein Q604_UNBC16230G0001, partial [human gut metagenome]
GHANMNCCEYHNKIKFCETNIRFEIKNLVITVQGTIGDEPFIGTYTYHLYRFSLYLHKLYPNPKDQISYFQ